ncbi:MAG: amidohydrolase family protein [Brevundimonas sp.]
MTFKLAALRGAVAGLLALTASCEQSAVRTDHHVHVHAPEILTYLSEYCASPGRMGPCDPAFVRPYSINDLLAEMGRAGVGRAYLMSSGYLAESPMMVPARPDAAELLHTANAFTVAQARAHPGRIIAFIGLNPLTDTALSEIVHWSGDPHAAGVKLHLTNSDVDLRDPAHVQRLATVFEAAADADMAIMIHLRTRAGDYGRKDVAIFLDQVLPHAGDTPVIIAHAGGWGGLDANTWDALNAFAEAARLSAFPNLRFDLAQVFDADTSPAELARLGELMRRIGTERFLAGSDWPFSGDLARYLNGDYVRLPLSKEERDALFDSDIIRRP